MAIGNDIRISTNMPTIKVITPITSAMIPVIITRGKGQIPAKKEIVIINKEYDIENHSGKKDIVHGQQQTPQTKEDNQEQPHTRVPGHAVISPTVIKLKNHCISPHTRAIILEIIIVIADKPISTKKKIGMPKRIGEHTTLTKLQRLNREYGPGAIRLKHLKIVGQQAARFRLSQKGQQEHGGTQQPGGEIINSLSVVDSEADIEIDDPDTGNGSSDTADDEANTLGCSAVNKRITTNVIANNHLFFIIYNPLLSFL